MKWEPTEMQTVIWANMSRKNNKKQCAITSISERHLSENVFLITNWHTDNKSCILYQLFNVMWVSVSLRALDGWKAAVVMGACGSVDVCHSFSVVYCVSLRQFPISQSSSSPQPRHVSTLRSVLSLQRTWFKWTACIRQRLEGGGFIWIRCVGAGVKPLKRVCVFIFLKVSLQKQ